MTSLQSPDTATGRVSGRRCRTMAKTLVWQRLGLNVDAGTSQLIALAPDGSEPRQEQGWGDLLYPFTNDRGHVVGLLYMLDLSTEDAGYDPASSPA